MSKPVKNLITDTYKKRFAELTGAVVVDIRGIEANDNNRMRTALAEKHIRVTVIKNSLARKAIEGTDLALLDEVINGPSTMVYTTDEDTSVVNIARELIDWAKQLENLGFRGAVMEGIVFGPDEIKKLSEYPTREEAQGKVIQLLLSPAQNLVSAVTGPGKQLASIVKTIQDKLEKGEEITKAS